MTPADGGADLHLHTTFSDGLYSPEQLVAQARAKGLRAIAVTDHDSLGAVASCRAAAEAGGIEVISGVEFGTPHDPGAGGEEIHIVGLFLDHGGAVLADALAAFALRRRERVAKMSEQLNRCGVTLRPEQVFALATRGTVGRLHVARALVAAGHVGTIGAAFSQWLSPDRPAYVPQARPGAAETIALIHRAGGAAVMAHPGQTRRDAEIPALVEAGLDGLEAFCADHSAEAARRYTDLAGKFGLLLSGGSDDHGRETGGGLGTVRVPMECVEALRRRARDHAEAV